MTFSYIKMVRNGEGIPWWVNSIYKVGVPTAIACYLVWLLATRIQVKVEAIQNVLTAHTQDQVINFEYNKKILEILRAMCVHGAKTDEQRTDCLK